MAVINVDDIGTPQPHDAWKPEIGDIAAGTITYLGKIQRTSQFTGLLEEVLRVDLHDEDQDVTIWAPTNTNVNGDGYPKRIAKAISAAARAANARTLEEGGILAIRRLEDFSTEKGMAKDYGADYTPPAREVEAF